MLLYVGFLPMLLYSVYVYGTIPMIFFCAWGFYLFVRYVTAHGAMRRPAHLVGMAAVFAAGYVLKSNALIPMIAVAICSLLYGMAEGDTRPLIASLCAIALGFALSRLVVWQYELRAGFPLEPNVCLLTYLMMGLGESASMPGWYNGYVGEFYDMYLTADAQRAIVHADLAARLPQLLADPAYTAAFLRDKMLSQWLEPTYSSIWYPYRCDWSGHFNGVAAMLYRPGHRLNAIADAYMNVYQQALYLLACLGVVVHFREHRGAAALVLPVTLLGGMLFHLLFEAKSQYIYPYAIYMIPLSARGLHALSKGLARATVRITHRDRIRA